MKKCNIGVLGATGAVGMQMIEVLQEYEIPVGKFVPFASSRSKGKKILFNGEEVEICEALESADSFKGLDFVLGAVENDQAKLFAPYIVKAGAVFIDNSSAFRMEKDVPLIVPEINGQEAFKNKGIIANPNCSTIITLMAVAALARISPIKTMVASTYQAVSGAGINGQRELESQMKAFVDGSTLQSEVFSRQIALNVIPQIGSIGENLYSSEEMKLQNEGRKILGLPDMKVSCTCVRVPVMRSHSISATVVTENKISVEDAAKAISSFPGVKLVELPTPIDTSGQDTVYAGRIREDLTNENGLNIWCCGDQVRKGAASNAVQILKLLIQ